MIILKCNSSYASNVGKVLYEWPFKSINGARQVSPFVKKDGKIYFVTGKELVSMEKPNKFKVIKDIPLNYYGNSWTSQDEVKSVVFNPRTSCFFGIKNVMEMSLNDGGYEYDFSTFHACLDGSFNQKDMIIESKSGDIFTMIINNEEYVCIQYLTDDYKYKVKCKSWDNESLEIKKGDNLTSNSSKSTIINTYIPHLIDIDNGQIYGTYNGIPFKCDLNFNNCKRIAIYYEGSPYSSYSSIYADGQNIVVLLNDPYGNHYLGTGTLNLVNMEASETEIKEKSDISWNKIDGSFNYIFSYKGEIYSIDDLKVYKYDSNKFVPIAGLVISSQPILSNDKIYYISSSIIGHAISDIEPDIPYSLIGYINITNDELGVITSFPGNPVKMSPLKNGNIVVLVKKGIYNETGVCKKYTCYKYSLLFYDQNGKLLSEKDFNGKYAYLDKTTMRDLWSDYVTLTYEDDNNGWHVKIYNLNGEFISEINNVGDYFQPQFLRKINGKLYLIGQDGDWLYVYDCENDKNVSFYSWNKAFKALEAGDTVYVSAIDGGLNANYYTLYGSISLKNLLSQGKITKLRLGNFKDFGYLELFSSKNGDVYAVGTDYDFDNDTLLLRTVKLGILNGAPVVYGDSGKIFISIGDSDGYSIGRINSDVVILFYDSWSEDRNLKVINVSDIIKPVSLSSSKDINLKWQEKYSRMENYASPFILPLAIDTHGNAYINENGSFVPYDENQNVTITITFPNYDVPYDVYIAYNNSQGLFFIGGEKGIDTNPIALFSNLNGPFYTSFDIPYKALPKGTYYLMVRKHGSNPYDFNNRGYKIWTLFNIQ